LSKEFGFPYYFGLSKLASLGSFNVEQFIRLAGDLFEESLAAAVMRRSPRLAPERQQRILQGAYDTRVKDLPRRAKNGRDVLRFLDAVGQFCRDVTQQPNAPYSPGVTGIAILMQEPETLLDPAHLAKSPPTAAFASMLGTAIAHNLLHAEIDYKVKGNRYMVLYLNRLLCPKYELPLQFGGFRERPLREFITWAEKGVPAPEVGDATMSPDSLRWRDYFLRDGEGFGEFWKLFLAERKRDLLFVIGHGFDARMCDGIERVLSLGGEGRAIASKAGSIRSHSGAFSNAVAWVSAK